jgi:hypothetical protein
MRKKITLFICCLCSLAIFSQNLKGIVIDEDTQQAIEAAHIYVDDATATITNKKGEFQLEINLKNTKATHIIVSHLGYVTKKVAIPNTQTEFLKIYLSQDANTLSAVSISGKKKLQASIQYTELASMRRGLYDFASDIHNEKIYVIGGDRSQNVDQTKAAARSTTEKYLEPTFDDFVNQLSFNPSSFTTYSGKLQVYDIEKDVWTTSDVKFRERSAHNLHVYNDEVYIFGGKRTSRKNIYLDDVIEIYDTKTNNIKTDNVNPHQATDVVSFLYGDYMILLGGVQKIDKKNKKQYRNDVHFYNLKTGLWYELGEMPTPKATQGVLLDDMIYLVGGFTKMPLKTIESFNLKTGEWHVEGELFEGMEKPALATHDKMIYIYNKGKLLTYNTASKELHEYLINLNVESAELLYHQDTLYILGGYTVSNFYNKSSKKMYAINIDEFKKTRIRNTKKTRRKPNS